MVSHVQLGGMCTSIWGLTMLLWLTLCALLALGVPSCIERTCADAHSCTCRDVPTACSSPAATCILCCHEGTHIPVALSCQLHRHASVLFVLYMRDYLLSCLRTQPALLDRGRSLHMHWLLCMLHWLLCRAAVLSHRRSPHISWPIPVPCCVTVVEVGFPGPCICVDVLLLALFMNC